MTKKPSSPKGIDLDSGFDAIQVVLRMLHEQYVIAPRKLDTEQTVDTAARIAALCRNAGKVDDLIKGLLRPQFRFPIHEDVALPLQGRRFIANCQRVTQMRLDGKALERDMPDIAARYRVSTPSMPITFKGF